MPGGVSTCPHVRLLGNWSWEEIRSKQEDHCHVCNTGMPKLWLCLVGPCQFVGCGEAVCDHSSIHAEEKKHCLTINLSTLRIWCYICEAEVHPDGNTPPVLFAEHPGKNMSNSPLRTNSSGDSSPCKSFTGGEDSDSDYEDGSVKPRGLTGLRNLGNTCYMNAALQSLSNCPALTRYFLDCSGFVRPDRNPMLSKSYLRLISEIWHKKRPSYVVPSGVSSGIKVVHPMFRGYSQQDTQEFLRCFMDQLHEELKYPVPDEDSDAESEVPESMDTTVTNDRHEPPPSTDSGSQSEVEYETCDSGLSSERSSVDPEVSSDEGEQSNRHQAGDGPDQDSRETTCDTSNNSEQVMMLPTQKEVKDSRNLLFKQHTDGPCQTILPGEEINQSEASQTNESMSDQESNSRTRTRKPRSKRLSETVSSPELLSPPRSPQKVNIGPASAKAQVQHKPSKDKKSVQYRSVISDIFDGKILSSVQCLTCERVSTTKETFQDLSLPIPNKDHLTMIHASQAGFPKGGTCGEVNQSWISWIMSWMRSWFIGPTITLQDCLAAFFSADELKGDNMYSCEKCKKLRNGIKYSKVLELPEVLSIHLKRFRHEFMFSTKIASTVSFPLEDLEMKQYLHKDCKSEITTYDLFAVICHHGTAGGGHYTAYCLNYLNDQWYEFDDQYVTEVDVQQVMTCEAYVLFYKKRNDAMLSQRQKAMELMELREPSLLQFYVSKQWINKFNTFAEPGPICNMDFLCSHGGVHPNRVSYVDELVVPLPQSVWEYLHDRYGGGPVCNHLYPCSQCQKELDALRLRQTTEMDTFIQLNEKFQEEDHPPVIYAISMSWFKDWETFVRAKTDNPPGPIDNSRITVMKNGQPSVRNSSDHGQLSKEMWQFLHGLYGGGPELILRQTLASMAASGSPAQSQTTATTTLSSNSTTSSSPTPVNQQAAPVTSQQQQQAPSSAGSTSEEE
ncbi:LOW QUALITY PROTEIN: ubiquitin carboxyl-terminal hydrolase 20-like [Liolophura sinensis]|uniref:LOW QUALITY PROTEIN: ubiquitin carboxyl-terminal hydrolase 20-like n=1 Tax=Liolophura sinensis TaxID=3198878 RepID=UPI0031593499